MGAAGLSGTRCFGSRFESCMWHELKHALPRKRGKKVFLKTRLKVAGRVSYKVLLEV